MREDLEYYSVIRTLRAVDRSSVTVAVLGATEGLTEQDKKIIGYAHESGQGLVIAVNKWDLVEKETNTMRDFEDQIRKGLLFADYAPIVFISALTGSGFLCFWSHRPSQPGAQHAGPTGRLNEIISRRCDGGPGTSDKGVQLRIYYATQVQVNPPVLRSMLTGDLMHFSYERYLENRLRQEYGFVGTPIILAIKELEK